ncbi:MAG: hypothetical protein C4320_06530, partial [Armatimonadota bacterium]
MALGTNPITVVFTNTSPDAGDLGKFIAVDAVRLQSGGGGGTGTEIAPDPTNYGAIASVVTTNDPNQLAIYGGTEVGRVFSINAQGTDPNDEYNASHRTSENWVFPAQNATPLGEISGAPALDAVGDRLFIPTHATDRAPGALVALRASTGAPLWSFSRST